MYKFDREAYDRRMEWYRDARFGMFIHWGPVSYTHLDVYKRQVGICTGDAKAEPESSENAGGKPFRAERGAVSERISGSADQLRK